MAPWLNCYKNCSALSSNLSICFHRRLPFTSSSSPSRLAFSGVSALISFQATTTTEKVVDWNRKYISHHIGPVWFIHFRTTDKLCARMCTSPACSCQWGLFGSRLIYRMMYVIHNDCNTNKRWIFICSPLPSISLSLCSHRNEDLRSLLDDSIKYRCWIEGEWWMMKKKWIYIPFNICHLHEQSNGCLTKLWFFWFYDVDVRFPFPFCALCLPFMKIIHSDFFLLRLSLFI